MATKDGHGPGNGPGKPARKEAKHGRLAIFPAAAINDSRISPNMLAVLAALSCHSSRSGFIDVSHAALAVRLGTTRQYVQRTLATLEAYGYLRSARRRRAADKGETTKAYRINMDYSLPVQYWRYVPTDYGSEPEEVWPEELISTLPPASPFVAPPATIGDAPPATIGDAPPATIGDAPRTIGINDRILDGVKDGAQARDFVPVLSLEPDPGTVQPEAASLAAQVAAAAKLPPATNPGVLSMLLEAYAPALSPADLIIAATDCADWYATNRNTTPRLGNLSEWLRREQARRQEVATHDAANAHSNDNAAAGPSGLSGPEPGRARARKRGATRTAGRAPADQRRAHDTDTGGPDDYGWSPGHRVYIPDEPGNDNCEWYTVITEHGRRVRFSSVTGYVNPEEAYEPDNEPDNEPNEPASATGTDNRRRVD